MFDFVPAIPTETMCYYSTMFISVEHRRSHSFSTETPFDTHISLLQMDENDILVTVVPAKGGIVLMSRMMLEWSWRCNMCMGMVRRRFLSIIVRHS